jgi:hypothetical protein
MQIRFGLIWNSGDDSFLHAQICERQADPHGTSLGGWSRSARSINTEEVAETLSPRENGSV